MSARSAIYMAWNPIPMHSAYSGLQTEKENPSGSKKGLASLVTKNYGSMGQRTTQAVSKGIPTSKAKPEMDKKSIVHKEKSEKKLDAIASRISPTDKPKNSKSL